MNLDPSLPELDLSDYGRLKRSVKEVESDPRQREYYSFLARTPVCCLTAVGGWTFRRSAQAYLLVGLGIIIPPLRMITIALLMITLLSSFGPKSYNDSMIRLHILRRYRARNQGRIKVLSEPPLVLFSHLSRTTGVRSIEEFARVVRRARAVRRGISMLMLMFMAMYAISIPIIFLHFWIATPSWVAPFAAKTAILSLYGMVIITAILIGTAAIASNMIESKRPVYVMPSALEAVTSVSN